jgi:hypothetical protein
VTRVGREGRTSWHSVPVTELEHEIRIRQCLTPRERGDSTALFVAHHGFTTTELRTLFTIASNRASRDRRLQFEGLGRLIATAETPQGERQHRSSFDRF